jgi:hypothetical protein
MTRIIKFAAGGVIVLLVILGLVLRRHIHAKAQARRAAQAQREFEYNNVLSAYQRDLHPGMTRSQVKAYLGSRTISYLPEGTNERQYDIPLGDEPGDGFVCDRWNVYVALNFNTSANVDEPSERDMLQDIKIEKIGHCL